MGFRIWGKFGDFSADHCEAGESVASNGLVVAVCVVGVAGLDTDRQSERDSALKVRVRVSESGGKSFAPACWRVLCLEWVINLQFARALISIPSGQQDTSLKKKREKHTNTHTLIERKKKQDKTIWSSCSFRQKRRGSRQ